MPRCLGKLPPKHDKRTLRFARYVVASALPPAPASVTWSAKATMPWGQMLNDREGCCTCATVGHTIQSWTANNGGEVTITDQAVQNAYIAVTGQEGAAYDPTTGANDNGCVILDVLNYWRSTGIGSHKLGAYAAVSPQSEQEIKESIWLFGVCYLGVALPLAAQQQLNAGQAWDVPARIPFFRRRMWQPGSWGGHAVPAIDFDATGVTVVTWGQLQKVSWAWLADYMDEGYALLAADWVDGTKPAPSGFDMATLATDLQAITGS